MVGNLRLMLLTHLGTDRSPRSDFSGLQRMVMTELRPWSHDAVACRDLRKNKVLYFIKQELIIALFFYSTCSKS